uniref:Pre-mRNA-processing factor 19 n=1 Tax=Rhabditophanes sp. KR3021 TaxID=114890 RepID=A0AC35U4H7_9BILA
MAFKCAISGNVPQEPVVSPVSGKIFEKRLLVAYVNENGTDPITDSTLSIDQIIPLALGEEVGIEAPRNFNATSVPGLMKLLQDEYDAVMLSNHVMRKQLTAARLELSHSLYQHDASCRVIARLTVQLNAARQVLSELNPGYQETVDTEMGEAESEISKTETDNSQNKAEPSSEIDNS